MFGADDSSSCFGFPAVFTQSNNLFHLYLIMPPFRHLCEIYFDCSRLVAKQGNPK